MNTDNKKDNNTDNNTDILPAYTAFADIYDEYMTEIPYEKWACNIINMLSDHGITEGIVAELGCGTGTMTRALSEAGYDMIGIDNSEDMLAVAREAGENNILYLDQDMREMELYGTVEAFISVCDSMNYLLSVEDLTNVLKKVNLYLEKDGIFVFDMKTEHLYRDILGDTVQYEENDYEEDGFEETGKAKKSEYAEEDRCLATSLVWKNHYDAESRIHTYNLKITFRYDNNDESYSETHFQRVFTVEEVITAITDAGMELIKIFDADTMSEPTQGTERVYYIVKECYQKNKYYAE